MMTSSFTRGYIQAFTAVICIFISWLGYAYGYMYVYGNILNNIDAIHIWGVVVSYSFIPICICILLLSIIVYSKQSNNFLKGINNLFLFILLVFGFIGARVFFIIPTILVGTLVYLNYQSTIVTNTILQDSTNLQEQIKPKEANISKKESEVLIDNSNLNTIESSDNNIKIGKALVELTPSYSNESSEELTTEVLEITNTYTSTSDNNRKQALAELKFEMAIELLKKKAKIEFITELTGLSEDKLIEIQSNMDNYGK